MFTNHFTTNFLQNAAVKKNWKSVNIWQTYGQNFVAYFLGHPVRLETDSRPKRQDGDYTRVIYKHTTSYEKIWYEWPQ